MTTGIPQRSVLPIGASQQGPAVLTSADRATTP